MNLISAGNWRLASRADKYKCRPRHASVIEYVRAICTNFQSEVSWPDGRTDGRAGGQYVSGPGCLAADGVAEINVVVNGLTTRRPRRGAAADELSQVRSEHPARQRWEIESRDSSTTDQSTRRGRAIYRPAGWVVWPRGGAGRGRCATIAHRITSNLDRRTLLIHAGPARPGLAAVRVYRRAALYCPVIVTLFMSVRYSTSSTIDGSTCSPAGAVLPTSCVDNRFFSNNCVE